MRAVKKHNKINLFALAECFSERLTLKIEETLLQEKISQNLAMIKQDIAGYNPTIVAVSKYYTYLHMVEAYKCGIRDFGESRVLDAISKINELDDATRLNSNYHFIGHLQTNKAKKAVGVFELIHSVESFELGREISKHAQAANITQKVLIQVNNSFEQTKFGIAPSQLETFLQQIRELKNVEVAGLMNMAPLTDNETELRKLFGEMYKLKEAYGLKELSMGMSNDYKIALDEGATIIRLGRILFE